MSTYDDTIVRVPKSGKLPAAALLWVWQQSLGLIVVTCRHLTVRLEEVIKWAERP